MAIIIGNNADNVLTGTASSDIITGANGNDQIDGGAGNDVIDGGNGNDTIQGGAGSDIILGGNGDDTIDGGSGSDIVSGGNGNDLLIYRVSENAGSVDVYDGGAGQDTLRLIVNQSQYNTAAFQTDVAHLQSLLSHGSASTILTSLNLAVTSIERLEVVVESTGNHAPTAHDDTAAAQEDHAVTISAATLLANDTDPDSGDTRALVSVQNAQNGTVSLDQTGNVVFTPTQNFSGIASFSYTMRDAAGASSTATVLVSVAAVADAPNLSVANATGNEDTAIALSITPALTDTDGSEHLSALLVSAIPVGATLSDGASHTFTASAGLTSVDILGWTLSGLRVTPPANSDVDFTLTVTATSQESSNGSTASTSAHLTVTVNPVADAPSLSVINATGNEDTSIALSITPALTDNDGSEHLSALVVSAIPDGATLSDGANHFTASGGQTSVDILGWTLSGLTVTPPANSDVDFTLTVTATSQEGASGPTASTSANLTVTVNPVADAPDLGTAPATGAADAAIPLSITVALTDPSETLGQVDIQGIPSAYALNHGTAIDDGHWVVAAADLGDLALLPNGAVTPGSFVLHVTATSIDGTSTASTTADLNVSVSAGASQLSGRVVDGYIAGATVYADANHNHVLDAGEASTTTNADGTFTLTGGSGDLVMFGGTDVSTGLAFEGTLAAPEGSTVVTPLTTLVAAIAASTGGDVAAAQAAVATAFGLDASVDLQTFDPVSAALTNDPNAVAVLSAAIQVQSTVVQISTVAGTTDTVYSAIVDAITNANGAAVDLSSPDTVGSIAIQSGVDTTAVATVTNVVTAANGSIQTATDLTTLAQAAQVAQGETTSALATTDFTDQAQVDALTQTYVADLATQVSNAQVGDVDGASTGTLGDDVLTGGSGVDAIDGLDGNDQISGGGGNDLLYGGAGNDSITGGDGNDLIDGGAGRDRAAYTDATGGVSIDMASGIVTGPGVGTDTLVSIESVRGSNYADSYVATGYSGNNNPATPATLNSFEGMGGDDTITGNGDTQISYQMATSGVTVDLALGTATGDASVGTDHFTGVNRIRGSEHDDTLLGSNNASGVEQFTGGAGNDFINGRGGFDRAVYTLLADNNVTGGINVDMAAGTVTGDASIGTDTLRSIESVRGTNFDDVYVATGFTASSANAGSAGTNANGAAFNEFEGGGGNDTITGNGNTRVAFYTATAGVTVDLVTGTATGDSSVGTDTITGGVISLTGSQYNDAFYGSNNAANTSEQFEGRGGDDFFDGRGGFDQAVYNVDTAVTTGISVNMAAGTVTGDAAVGTDTLSHIEAVRGTSFADTYVATGFNGASTNAGSLGTLNEFEGIGGNDTITGNGDTRISYVSASAGVTVDIAAGTAIGNASVGTDTFTGVSRVRGSNFDDTISGDGGNNILEGQSGNDRLDGRGGNDVLTGGAGADTFVTGSGADVVTDFAHGQGDRIDLTAVTSIHSLSDVVAHANQSGANTVITFSAGNTLTLSNVTLGNLVASDFVFAPANQAPTDIALSNASVAENSASGTVVGSLSATDPDAGDTAAFTLLDDAGGRFAVNGTNLVVAGALDYETATSHQVTVRVTDSASNTYDETFSIGVTNVNETPTGIALSNASVAENSASGTVVGALSATDPDAGDTATFTLLDDAGGLFAFNGTNLVVAGALDYEAAASHQVTVRVTDSASNTFDETFTIGVTDVNEAPTDIALSNASVAENSANGSVVGALSATDPDAGDTATFTLLDDAGGRFAINGTNLVVAGALDYETATSHQVTVRVTDSASNTYDETFTIGVTDVVGITLNGTSGNDSLLGTGEQDTLIGLAGNDVLQGFAANDVLNGGAGNDRAVYTDATGGITVNLAAGTVTGTGVGTDTLQSIELVAGSDFADTFVATGFSGSSTNAGSNGTFNEFEGRGGNDSITGNGSTRVSYLSADAGVTADIQAGTGSGTAAGDPAHVGTDTFAGVSDLRGSNYADFLYGSNNASGAQGFEGRGGDDTIDGRGGFDRAIYNIDTATTSGITVDMASGSVIGDSTVGHDTLLSVEAIRGTNFADSYVATGFTASSTNAGSAGTNPAGAAFNEFEGMGGNDTITGNGNTRIAFYNATAAVTVDLAAGSATGDSSVGTDTITGGVSAVTGSQFNDTLYGSNNAANTSEQFEGRGGNDTFDGRGGLDQAVYNIDTAVTTGINIDMAAGTVSGDAAVGTDTLVSIESVRGTNFADTYVATGYSGASTDTGLPATFNEFEGMGGNDTITGNNSNTRISYVSATAGVTVDIAAGTATGDASVGTDSFTGVSRVRGSNFNDTISGGFGNNILEGQNGNDTLTGRGGNDTLTGGAGTDHFVYTALTDGVDHITDFSGHGTSQVDVLDFSAAAFGSGLAAGGANTGTLDVSHFVANGTGPTTAAQVFWYNTTDHTVYYDADGSGAGAATAVAVIDNLFVVNNTDFHLI